MTNSRYLIMLEQLNEKAVQCGRDPEEITLIAVSKNRPVELLWQAYQAGCRHFGESRVQEALPKLSCLPADCHWHFIGTLQSNKAGKVIPEFCLIHSVDTLDLAKKISHISSTKSCMTPILLQVNTSLESSKHGLQASEWEKVLDEVNELDHIRVEGLMTMAPLTVDQAAIRHCFRSLFQLREKWRSRMKDGARFHQLSMGMSHDFLIAIEEGATLVRIGTAIFGQ